MPSPSPLALRIAARLFHCDLHHATKIAAMIDEELKPMRDALESFGNLGNPSDYPRIPNRLDVPFEWYRRAFVALRDAKPEAAGAR